MNGGFDHQSVLVSMSLTTSTGYAGPDKLDRCSLAGTASLSQWNTSNGYLGLLFNIPLQIIWMDHGKFPGWLEGMHV